METTITIHDVENVQHEPQFQEDVMRRVARAMGSGRGMHVDIFTNLREPQEIPEGRTFHKEPPGWIEYTIVYRYGDGGKLVVGALQRELGGTTEFHS